MAAMGIFRKDGEPGVAITTISDDSPSLEQQPRSPQPTLTRTSRISLSWTAIALMASYFVFSVPLYTLFTEYALRFFWFLYLTIATLVAATTALEAYDGLTPLRESRKALQKAADSDWKFATAEDELPGVHLIFDGAAIAGQSLDLKSLCDITERLRYPDSKLFITAIRLQDDSEDLPSIEYIGNEGPNHVRLVAVPSHAQQSQIARIAYCMSHSCDVPVTAVFGGEEIPHPLSVRLAVERLLKEKKVDVVQGRVVNTTAASPLGSLVNLAIDTVNGLLAAGRAITWTFGIAQHSGAYWRTEVLQATAYSSAAAAGDGADVSYAALTGQVRTIHDLGVTSFTSSAFGWKGFSARLLSTTRGNAVACARYANLVFRRHGKAWTVKTRFGIFYSLVLSRVASHTVLQFFSMCLALLITQTPHSVHDAKELIHLQFPLTVWWISAGSLSMVATTAIAYKARSEFVPLWTAPFALIACPLMLLCYAFLDVLGQFDAIAQ